MATDLLPADKNSAVDPVSSESANYSVSEKAKEITNSERHLPQEIVILILKIARKKKTYLPKITPVLITDPCQLLIKTILKQKIQKQICLTDLKKILLSRFCL